MNPYEVKPIYRDPEFILVAVITMVLIAIPAEWYAQVKVRLEDPFIWAGVAVIAGRMGIRLTGVIGMGRERAAAQVYPPAPQVPRGDVEGV